MSFPGAPDPELKLSSTDSAAHQIDLWLCRVDDIDFSELGGSYWNLLNETERHRYGRFHFEKDRRSFLATRALTRTVLSRYLDTAPEAIHFSVNAFGRPALDSHQHATASVSFNLSHSEHVVALVVTATGDVGIDIERLPPPNRVPVELAANYFSELEVADLGQLPAQLQGVRFMEYWTLKEAYIKARGLGLSSLPLDSFGFRFLGGSELQFLVREGVDDGCEHWHFLQMQFEQDYVLAVCVSGLGFHRRGLSVRKIVPLAGESRITPSVLRVTSGHLPAEPLSPRQ